MSISKDMQWLAQEGIKPGQERVELEWLCRKVKALQCNCMVEIGSRFGGSLYLLAQQCMPGATIVSVDVQGFSWGKSKSASKLQFVISKLNEMGFHAHWVNGLSGDPDVVLKVRELTGNNVDFLFIDGDHRFEYVMQDWDNYRGMVKENGMIGFHDIAFDPRETPWGKKGVSRLWEILKPAYRSEAIILSLMGIGILYKGDKC